MKFFLAFALIVAVASAGVVRNPFIEENVQQIAEIIAAIESPSTDPATAQLLEQMLLDLLGQSPAVIPPVSVVDEIEPAPITEVDEMSPIGIGPAIVEEVAPENPAATSSLVEIIINVNAQTPPGVEPVAISEPENTPVVERPVPEPIVDEVKPTPVAVAETPDVGVEPVQVAEPVFPIPVVVEPVLPIPVVVEPVQVGEPALPTPEIVVEPVQVGEPALPIPVVPVVLPEELN